MQNFKSWHHKVNVNEASLLSVWPRWLWLPREIQISLKVPVFKKEFSTSKLQKHWNERDRGRRGRREEWRDREREGREGHFVRDIARTSPRSHMVVEKVLYGCVCLSVPFRIFTGKRRRPSVCNNISPSFPPLLFYYPQPSLSLFFCLCVAALPEICLGLSSWLMPGVDSRL